MKTHHECSAGANDEMQLRALVDQHCGQRYTVLVGFLNLYLRTGKDFYKECAETFVYRNGPAVS